MSRGPVNQTFDALSPSEVNIIPSCCMPRGLPIYDRMRDTTITTAPRMEAAKSDCRCDTTHTVGGTNLRIDRTYDPNVRYGNDELMYRPLRPEHYQNQTYRPNRPQYGPSGFRMNQTETYPMRPLGFDHLRAPIGFEQYTHGSNVTEVVPSFLTTNDHFPPPSYDESHTYPDMGPWRNFEIPRRLPRVKVAPSANKSYPRTNVPPPSRYYSTYEDHQPILNVPEVTKYRRRAPRFYSTPTEANFPNEGTNVSSLWGQNATDSSYGWVEGVRMDSFNVFGEITPSPKKVKVPPRLQKSYMPATSAQKIVPAFQQTHTYLPEKWAHLKWPPGFGPTPTDRRVLRKTTTFPTRRTESPGSRQPSGSSKRNETYCDPCGNTFSATGPQVELNKTTTISRRGEDNDQDMSQAAKNFCTVLEIRTPCENNGNQPDKPLQLSIHVTCADPSLLVTPDKRYNVITNSSTPEMSEPNESSNQLEGSPSDCACG